MEQLVWGLVFSILLLVVLVVVGLASGTRREPHPEQTAGYADDEGWIPLALGPVRGYASLTQGGRAVGYAEMRELNLPPGWEAGPKGMRPFTREARAAWERESA